VRELVSKKGRKLSEILRPYRMNVRPSNTEPLLRLNLEARSRP
jgi:phosphomannomutase